MPAAPRRRRRARLKTRAAWLYSLGFHLVLGIFLAAQVVQQPAPDEPAVVYIKLEVPASEELVEAPIDIAGFEEEREEDGAPIPTEEPTEHLETPDEKAEELLAKGDPDARGSEDREEDEHGSVVGVGGGGKTGRFGAEQGGGLIESHLSEGARRGLRRFRSEGLDVVICLDTTGSMASAIAGAKRDARGLVELVGTLVPQVRFGLVTYGDEVRDVVPLTVDRGAILGAIDRQSPSGGGDGPEGVDKALAAALDREKMKWGLGAWPVIVVIGDAPPHREDRTEALTLVRRARGREEKLVVSTVSAAGGGLVPTFGEIANAGGGDAVALGNAGAVGRALVSLAFGPQVGAEIEAWARKNEDLLTARFGFGASAERFVRLGVDRSLAPPERFEALLAALTIEVKADAVAGLVELAVLHPEVLEGEGKVERICAVAGCGAPEADAPAEVRRAAAWLALARLAKSRPDPSSGFALAKMLDEARAAGDAPLAREVAAALAAAGGPLAGEALARAAEEDPDLLDESTLLGAMSATADGELVSVVVERLVADEGFRERCLKAADRDRQVAIGLLLIEQLGRAAPEEVAAEEGATLSIASDPERDRKLGALVELPDRALAAAFAGSLEAAAEKERDEEEAAALGAVARLFHEVAGRMRFERLSELVIEHDELPLEPLIAFEVGRREARPLVLELLVSELEFSPRYRFRKLVERVREMGATTRAEIAQQLRPAFERAGGARRRDLFRFFADSADRRGLDLMIEALRWDGGKLMDEVIDGLERVTGLDFKSARRSARARAEQALRLEWWWEKNRRDWGH